MVINRAGLVWAGRRANSTKDAEGSGTWWQMPQGGVEPGEDPAAAARRELFEETGIRTVIEIAEMPRLADIRPSGRTDRPGVGRPVSRTKAEVVRLSLHRRRQRDQHYPAARARSRIRRVAMDAGRRAAGPDRPLQARCLSPGADGIRVPCPARKPVSGRARSGSKAA